MMMINLDGAMVILKAVTCLMAVGQQGVKLYKRSRDPKDTKRGLKSESRGVELGSWISEYYLHQMP